MTAREQLFAYVATLITLVTALLGAMLISAWVPAVLGKIEVFALGTVFGGLIGVLRIPSVRSVTVDNPPSDPVPTTPATAPTNGDQA